MPGWGGSMGSGASSYASACASSAGRRTGYGTSSQSAKTSAGSAISRMPSRSNGGQDRAERQHQRAEFPRRRRDHHVLRRVPDADDDRRPSWTPRSASSRAIRFVARSNSRQVTIRSSPCCGRKMIAAFSGCSAANAATRAPNVVSRSSLLHAHPLRPCPSLNRPHSTMWDTLNREGAKDAKSAEEKEKKDFPSFLLLLRALRAFAVQRFVQSQPNWRVRKPLPTWRTIGRAVRADGRALGRAEADEEVVHRVEREGQAAPEGGAAGEARCSRRSRQASVPSSAQSSASMSASSSSGPRLVCAGERGRQRAEQEGVAPPRLAGDADRREIRRPLRQAARIGGRERQHKRFDAVLVRLGLLPRPAPADARK